MGCVAVGEAESISKKGRKIAMKRLSVILAVVMLLSAACISPAYATDGFEFAPAAEERASWRISTTATHSIGTSYSVLFDIVLTVRNEASNVTGGYITGVNSVTVSNVRGWNSVNSQPVDYYIVSTADNGQVVTIHIEYEASIGAGYTTYDTDVQIRLADI